MKSLILFAFSESTESTKLDALSSVEAEITDNLNQAVENANNFIQSLEKYLPKIIAFGINVCIAIAILQLEKS